MNEAIDLLTRLSVLRLREISINDSELEEGLLRFIKQATFKIAEADHIIENRERDNDD